MKIGRNSPCPCGSGKKYKKCCLNKDAKLQPSLNIGIVKRLPSDFDYIIPISEQINKIIKKYSVSDVSTAIFCLNLWRRNRSALAQSLSLNLALSIGGTFGSQSIKSYDELESFYNEISSFVRITYREDYIIDDFGEVFINHAGQSYPIIIGTGHQQVYSAMRYMQTLASLCNKDDELTTLLAYIDTIIKYTKTENTPNNDHAIVYELPSEAFWNAVKKLFALPLFQTQVIAVSQIMGYQFGPIEMRHFIQSDEQIFPLCNTSLLVDYYKILLANATETEKDSHVTQTIHSLIENSFNFSSNAPNRVLINPVIIHRETKERILSEGLIFAGLGTHQLLIAISKKAINNEAQFQAVTTKIQEINQSIGLCLLEPYYRKGMPGAYGVEVAPNCEITYMVIDSFTDIATHAPMLEEASQYYKCTALDALYLLGFSKDLKEIIDFIHYDNAESAQIFSFGGKNNLFFTWKEANRLISSGAIEYNHLFLDYNEAEEYTYSYFKDLLCDFPQNNTGLFRDPLNWNAEKADLGYNRIYHKGCYGFGGEIKYIGNGTYVFLAHNVEFFTEEDFAHDAHTALKTVDDLNQRLLSRYADYINSMDILTGRTLQLLFMPWPYANRHYAQGFLLDSSREIVFSDMWIEQDSVIIRYSTNPDVFMSVLENATDRHAENKYFSELLRPLCKYSPDQYKVLEAQLAKDSLLKKTVGVFHVERHYYFSDKALDTDISAQSFAKARKEIAKVCMESGIEPGEYHGKNATKAIRAMQLSVVQVFENYISGFDMYDLHSRVLGYYAIQQNGVILNIKRYTAFTNLDEEVQREFEQKTRDIREEYRRNVRSAEYLLESNLAVAHSERSKKCSKEEFEFLLAFADWLVVLQDDADTCHYTDFDLSISVDSEYKVDTLLSENARQNYDALLLRRYNTRDYQIKDDTVDLDFFKKAINAFHQDTGIELGVLVSLVEYMQLGIVQDAVAIEIYPNTFEIDRSTLENSFNEILVDKITEPSLNALINFLTLDTSALKTVNGTQHDILPIWEREKRDNRFSVKPIIMHDNKCVFSPVTMYNVLTSWKSGITEWYLPYEVGLPTLQEILKQWKKRYEDEMVQDIAQLFRNAKFDIVIPEVDLVHRFPRDDYPAELGDYDVVAINKSTHEIWIIESKVLQKVGSIYEDQMQQKSFFFQHKDDEKFQRRIDYMVTHTAKILTSFDIDETGYQIIPHMVTNKLFSSRYKKISFPIITYSELRQLLEEYSN